MSIPTSCSTLRLPAGFRSLLEQLVLEVLRAQPTDVVVFAADYFQRLLRQREDGSVDPMAWGAQMEDQLLSQELEKNKKEDKDKGEE